MQFLKITGNAVQVVCYAVSFIFSLIASAVSLVGIVLSGIAALLTGGCAGLLLTIVAVMTIAVLTVAH